MENKVLNNNDLILNKSIKGILIDSLINTHEMFLNSFSKKIFDNNSLNEYKQKLKIKDEYQHCLTNDALLTNKYSDKLSFRNNDSEKADKVNEDDILIVDNTKGESLKKTKMEQFGIKRDDLEEFGEKKRTKTDNTSLATIDQSILEKNALLEKIPEKYRVKGDEDKNQNLVVSLIKNQNHITFRKDKYVAPEWHAPWKLSKVLIGQHTGWVRCIDVDPTNNW